MKKLIVALIVALLCSFLFAADVSESNSRSKIKVLILPNFEVDTLYGDKPGEAQFYYEGFLLGGDEYDIRGGFEDNKLYVKDGVALYVTGLGKVNSSMSTLAVLSDDRFDFSDAYIISTGCAGSAMESTVLGDVFIISAVADYDAGHHADPRDLGDLYGSEWFHESAFDSFSNVVLSEELTNKVYDLVKDVPLQTTEITRNYLAEAFDNAEWAVRDPKVQKGSAVSSDNYWKGEYGHKTAVRMTETYGFKDPYISCDMEDVAIGIVLRRLGMLDRYIIIRNSVNMDVFMPGITPEILWSEDASNNLVLDHAVESAGAIFSTAVENNYKVGKIVIDAILEGTL